MSRVDRNPTLEERKFPKPVSVIENDKEVMRIARKIIGALLILVGAVWFLQGINIIPGSFMTGQTKWAAYGVMTMIAGLFLILAGRTKRPIP